MWYLQPHRLLLFLGVCIFVLGKKVSLFTENISLFSISINLISRENYFHEHRFTLIKPLRVIIFYIAETAKYSLRK